MYTQVTINPFNFTDLSMASEVRTVVFTLLVRFDENRNKQFEEHQIKEALMKLLNEDPAQLTYVTRNVFRYDLNNDGVVTYQQFVNFCVEHHFGEIAIQRLHRQKAYTSGARLKMNKVQFKKTLTYALSFIKYVPSESIMEKLFSEIGPNQEGFITYVQYFQFLKHFFGSKSQTAENINLQQIFQKVDEEDKIKNEKEAKLGGKQSFRKAIFEETNTATPQSNLNLSFKNEEKRKSNEIETGTSRHPEINSSQREQINNKMVRLNNLINHQVILSIMKYDRTRTLNLSQNEAEQALASLFQFDASEVRQLIPKILKNNNIAYEDLMEVAIEYQMCVKTPMGIHSLNKSQFALRVKEGMNFLRAQPVDLFFEQIFMVFLGDSHSLLTQQSFVFLMETMFKKEKKLQKKI